MGDKYEELLEEYQKNSMYPFIEGMEYTEIRAEIKNAFRWYDAKREEEMCEYIPTYISSNGTEFEWASSCGDKIEGFHGKYCWSCGRLIVVKQSVVAPADKGVQTKSVQVTPDE